MKRQPISDYDFVMLSLEANKGRLVDVAAETGIPYSTITKIGQSVIKNPGVKSIQCLAGYFRKGKK